jgi:PAS domain S-box-containing protein
MPTEILGTQRDITQETIRAKEINNLMLRSHTVFNSSLVDMIYYDANGYLADLNETACHTFGVKDAKALIKRGMKMNDIPSYREIDVQKLEHTTLSSITDIAQVKATDERVPEVTVTSKMYYEVMLGPIRDQLNHLMGVIAAGRDITEMVESNHRMKESSRLIEERTKALQQYVRDINYSLKVSESRLVNYYPDCHELEILSDLSGPGKRIPQLHAMALMHKDDQRAANNIIKRMDRRHMGTISETLHTKLQDKQGRDI